MSAMRLGSIDSDKVLIILSDMRNCSEIINFEPPDQIPVEKALQQVEQAGLIPDLKKVKVFCLGVHTAGKSPVYWQSLKAFWTQYFEKAGVEKLVFKMERGFSI